MKVVLSIAGSDSSGGAGIQADLKTFEAFGVFGTSVVTVLTAQNTTGVTAIHAVPSDFVRAQIEAVFNDFEVAAIKIGMLYSAEIMEVVKGFISRYEIPVVLDPVFISKAGSPLLQEDTVERMKELFEHASLITPNQFEAKALFGYLPGDTGPNPHLNRMTTPVLIKNETIDEMGIDKSIDKLFISDVVQVFESERIPTNNLHGTGCSYSSAIAANLALGKSLQTSISIAKQFITQALKHAPDIGHGPGPINHKQGGQDVA